MSTDQRVITLLQSGLTREAVAVILELTVDQVQDNIGPGDSLPPPSGGGGGGGLLDVGDPLDTSARAWDTFWTPGDGTHPTWVAADFRVTAAPGQSAVAWVEIWPPDNFDNSGILGSVELDRTAETGDAGDGNAIVEGWAYGLVPPGWRARLKWDATGGSAAAVAQHERVLTIA